MRALAVLASLLLLVESSALSSPGSTPEAEAAAVLPAPAKGAVDFKSDAADEPLHWAYLPPAQPGLPKIRHKRWVKNPIDYFILARLEKEKLRPSPEADRVTLIRRVSLDLIGLPPTIEEVDTFLNDRSKEAYANLVQRLLGSLQYGEKWAQLWLDLARYADTHGYEKDPRRNMWPYRDWVIQAFNRNIPFDQFTLEQIAGDLLPNPTQEQLIASGFHRNTMFNTEGGVDPEESRVERIIDRANTTATVWLGTTLACAQCHTHKYDPISQKEYYQFFAFFNNSDEPELDLPTPGQKAKRDELRKQIEPLEKIMKTHTPELEAAQRIWEQQQLDELSNWSILDPGSYSSEGKATLDELEDHSLLATGDNPTNDTYTITAFSGLQKITGLRLEVVPDEKLPQGGPGRHYNGNFVLSQIGLKAAPSNQLDAAQSAILSTNAAADYTESGYKIASLVSAKGDPGWSIDAAKEGNRVERWAYFALEKPVEFKSGAALIITLKQRSQFPEANLGRFRLSVSGLENPVPKSPLSHSLRQSLVLKPEERTEKQKNELAEHFRSIAPELKTTRDQLAELKKNESELKRDIITTLIMKEREQPRDTYVHIRGNFLNKGEKVAPDVPAVFPPLSTGNQPANRLTLARWLVSTNNPLTARVLVNRIWEQYFGRGLVETMEDFGTQGAMPTHPELLDWLVTEFMRAGWDLKALHRLIVSSATYRQSSRVTPELLERDPDNRLLARGPRFRVSAEAVRDIALTASGLLRPKIGGPSVFPYQPEGIWTQIYSGDKWVMSERNDKYRRGFYTFWRRTSPYPAFVAFDAPSREYSCTRRPRTNTPLQALTTLNDPAFVEAAQVMARRIVTQAGTEPERRVIYAFRLCLSRKPQPNELQRLVKLYQDELAHFKTELKAAELMAFGENTVAPEGFDLPELAAWTVVANVLLNLDETITKE